MSQTCWYVKVTSAGKVTPLVQKQPTNWNISCNKSTRKQIDKYKLKLKWKDFPTWMQWYFPASLIGKRPIIQSIKSQSSVINESGTQISQWRKRNAHLHDCFPRVFSYNSSLLSASWLLWEMPARVMPPDWWRPSMASNRLQTWPTVRDFMTSSFININTADCQKLSSCLRIK